MAQPKSIANEVSEDIKLLMSTFVMYSPQSQEILESEFRAKQLSKVEPSHGYMDLACLAMLSGNYKLMRDRAKIASIQSNFSEACRANYATMMSHAGFFSEGYSEVKKSWTSFQNPSYVARASLFLGALSVFKNIMQKYRDNIFNQNEIELAFRDRGELMANYFEEHKISDEQYIELLDIVGEVTRSHKVFKESFLPSIVNSGSIMVLTFPVNTSYDLASQMTWELAEKLCDLEISKKLLARFRGHD